MKEEEGEEIPPNWNVRAKCEPEMQWMLEEMKEKMERMETNWKMRKKQLPWEKMKGFRLEKSVPEWTRKWEKYSSKKGCPVKEVMVERYLYLKDLFINSPIDKDPADMLVL